MRILIVSPEIAPFYKTGGLGDVAGSLARALVRRGHDARLAMPRYRIIDAPKSEFKTLMPEILVDVEGQSVAGAIDAAGGEVPVYFVRCDRYFDRGGAYGEVVAGSMRDYTDNIERFAFFCMAVVWMLKGLDWQPDVIHCSDWQTALIPVYLRTHPVASTDPFYRPIRVLYTIHNLAYQGRTSPAMLPRMGLGPDVSALNGLEFHGGLNLMKGGIVYSDHITTVSERYAKEIQTPELGCGLDSVLRHYKDRLTGILNGIDYEEWNPAADPFLAAHYDERDFSGKAACKVALQREAGLEVEAKTPLIGMVSRLSTQKGYELVDAVLTLLVEKKVQLVMLGNGEQRYHRMLERMGRKFPGNVTARLKFDGALAHRIEAGADMFLMPSYYEPCGLNQMYSMRYGTPPIVRRTGGLADSVTPCTPAALRSGKATGFVFGPYTPRALMEAVDKALLMYREAPDDWRRLMRNAMKRDFSWDTVAAKYEALYGELAAEAPPTAPE